MQNTHHIAQLNIATLVAPLDSSILGGFVANLDRINALADQSPGFVWRLQTADGDATAIRHFGDDVIVNLSVWETVEALFAFVFQSAHIEMLRRRKEWFQPMEVASSVLWWIPSGHELSLDEAQHALHALRSNGPSPAGFTFKERFLPPNHA